MPNPKPGKTLYILKIKTSYFINLLLIYLKMKELVRLLPNKMTHMDIYIYKVKRLIFHTTAMIIIINTMKSIVFSISINRYV